MDKNHKKKQTFYPKEKLIECLFKENLRSLVVLCHENERPLQGFAAEVDWHFYGYLSKQLKKGIITGSHGECTLIPLKKGDELFTIYILGAGEKPHDKKQKNLNESLKVLTKNLASMNIDSLGVREDDFHNGDLKKIEGCLSHNAQLWVFQ